MPDDWLLTSPSAVDHVERDLERRQRRDTPQKRRQPPPHPMQAGAQPLAPPADPGEPPSVGSHLNVRG